MLRVLMYCSKQRFQWWDINKGQIEYLCYRRPSLIEVSPSWKTRYLSYCITAMKIYYKKDGFYRRCACFKNIVITILLQKCIFRIGELDIWHTWFKAVYRINQAKHMNEVFQSTQHIIPITTFNLQILQSSSHISISKQLPYILLL